ncbi:MAG: molecular chaperone DnaJ [Candidatus Marinimicrobia bacterium]|nr:molecular chaperone DnaJ [Candidatus Neomarinimicrobiota bacterium]
MKDYYEILGVDKSSSEQEIKKAYRKVAMKNHPDRNPDDSQAESRFKEAAEAYSVLSDAQKKQQYDTFGHAGVNQNSAQGFNMNVEDIFSSFGDIFGGMGFGDIFGSQGGSHRRSQSAGDLKISLKLTMEEIYSGVQKKVRVKRNVRNGQKSDICNQCQGKGEIRMVQRSILGQIVNVQPCRNCKGAGYVGGTEYSSSMVEIDVPPGVSSGNYMTLKGKGNEGISQEFDGNLIVHFQEIEHSMYVRDEVDIYMKCELQYQQAVLGTTINVPTLSGDVKLKIPQGVKDGQVLRLKNKGMRYINSSRYGDQYVKIMINIPKKISKNTHKLLTELYSEIGDSVNYKRFND